MPNTTAAALPRDANFNPIQTGGDIQTQDNTGTPIPSPLSLTTTAVFTLVVPAKALTLVLRSAGNVRFGDNATLDGTADEGYGYAPATEAVAIPVSNMDNVYVRNDSTGTNNLYFYFEMGI